MSFNHFFPFNASLDLIHFFCFNSTLGEAIFNALSATRLVLLIPLYIFVLHLGIQQWRQHHSFKATSHSDIFTYCLAVIELMWTLWAVLSFVGAYFELKNLILVRYFFDNFLIFAEISFHILTCVDRYLAIVHPVTYCKLRKTSGVTIRNISIFCVLLLSLILNSFTYCFSQYVIIIMFFCFLVTSLVVVSYCSLSVLFVLYRPGPGAGGGTRGQIDQSKQRAFFTIMAIMGVLYLYFLGFLVSMSVMVSQVLCQKMSYVVDSSLAWLSLPSSLVLPLLYLHKMGKLPCGHHSGS